MVVRWELLVPHFSVASVALSVSGAVVAFILLLGIPRTAATFRIAEVPSDEEPAQSFVGGGRWFGPGFWPVCATWPLTRLEQFGWGIRVGPNFRWIGWVVPTTELRWSEILVARRVRTGIRFNLRSDPRRRVSFGPSIDHRLITVLRHNGGRSNRWITVARGQPRCTVGAGLYAPGIDQYRPPPGRRY